MPQAAIPARQGTIAQKVLLPLFRVQRGTLLQRLTSPSTVSAPQPGLDSSACWVAHQNSSALLVSSVLLNEHLAVIAAVRAPFRTSTGKLPAPHVNLVSGAPRNRLFRVQRIPISNYLGSLLRRRADHAHAIQQQVHVKIAAASNFVVALKDSTSTTWWQSGSPVRLIVSCVRVAQVYGQLTLRTLRPAVTRA